MKHFLVASYAITAIIAGGMFVSAPSVAAATEVTPKAPKVTVDRSMAFRALPHAAYLEFRWKRYSKPSAFKMYTIVRSEPGGPTAPEAGDIIATTTNRYSTNVEDHPDKSGTYFYRLCVLRKDADIVCSKAIKVVYIAPARVATAWAPPTAQIIPVVTPTTTEAIVPILPVSPGELELVLTPSASGTILTWNGFVSRNGGSTTTVLVRSFATSSPSYPVDGYLAKLRDPSQTKFLDTVYVDPAMFHAKRWYRACAVDMSDNVYCGAAISITP